MDPTSWLPPKNLWTLLARWPNRCEFFISSTASMADVSTKHATATATETPDGKSSFPLRRETNRKMLKILKTTHCEMLEKNTYHTSSLRHCSNW